jgi:hypothetical protein
LRVEVNGKVVAEPAVSDDDVPGVQKASRQLAAEYAVQGKAVAVYWIPGAGAIHGARLLYFAPATR